MIWLRTTRTIAHFRMDALVRTHLSTRFTGEVHRFVLKPYGTAFDETTDLSRLILVPDELTIEEEGARIDNMGFEIRSALTCIVAIPST
ncbi:ribulose-5-phosphate 4-epimerase/fuculose-1-phosphate aldolase [Bradyrhizobium elkanii]